MKAERPTIPWSIRLRWQAFRLLERLGTPGAPLHLPADAAIRPSLWVFVSTIGEVNAIGPLLRELVARHADLQLVLLTDRSIYRESYLAQFPQAEVIEISASGAPAATLAQQRPPRLLVVAEIPCLPADAPCRLPFGYLYAARQAGARLALVNGWLYGYAPSCRMDDIERRLLGASYLQLFDVLCVQTEAVAARLRDAGAPANRLHVTGNIKFDAMQGTARPWQDTRSPQTLHSIEHSKRPIIVAGCVTDDDERDLVLDAFQTVLESHANALLVLAPRHPENPDVMRNLHLTLQARHLAYRCRSAAADHAVEAGLQVLVLDTMGELRDFYARASVAHVGRDHNVLEPLAFGKTVTVRPDWDSTYPSFPVYQLTSEHGLLIAAGAAAALATAWAQALPGGVAHTNTVTAALRPLTGATAACSGALSRLLAEGRT